MEATNQEEQLSNAAIGVMMHFPDLWSSDLNEDQFIDSLSCERCADLREGACQGRGLRAWDVVECMQQKNFVGGSFGMNRAERRKRYRR